MNRIQLEDRAQEVRTGADFRDWKKKDIVALQEYALSINDIGLYDWLEVWWTFKKFRK